MPTNRRTTPGKPRRGAPTPGHRPPAAPAPPISNPAPASGSTTRTVDLGREDELVTWNEWLARTMQVMRQSLPESEHARLAFRVTLTDGRTFPVRQVLAHVAHGRCTLGPSRWGPEDATCAVVTGYVFINSGEESTPAAIAVAPTSIQAVECVLLPGEGVADAKEPFGFRKRDHLQIPTSRLEVEEIFE